MRQVVLDTETTGLETTQDHRIIEIGCVELVNRRLTGRHYHQYINPQREVDDGALEVHGISNEFLADKPLFESVAEEFLAFIDGAELVIHNAPFDVGFIDHEFAKLEGYGKTADYCSVVDTLVMARQRHPGQKNNLDALCKRYDVDNSQRDLHGALLDAEILADVYLMMTGGQVDLGFGGQNQRGGESGGEIIRRLAEDRRSLRVIRAGADELEAHQQQLARIERASGGQCQWLAMEAAESTE
ncbi:MAG: DNA polymerase III subunit epsilon [Gammaproteobacteria bacterium]|nr:MAG: DNA polymerase III subunit epsilon [Gammaproteobacteria bacterium]